MPITVVTAEQNGKAAESAKELEDLFERQNFFGSKIDEFLEIGASVRFPP
jgi:hypothetical protein